MSVGEAHAYEFSNFRLYPADSLLLRNGRPVPLPPKSFQILCMLVENRGHLVEKDRLMRTVWPGTFVVENNLTYNISILRKALSENGDESNPFIVTFPKRGYRFVGEVRDLAAPRQPAELHATPSALKAATATAPTLGSGDNGAYHHLHQTKAWARSAVFLAVIALAVLLMVSLTDIGQRAVNRRQAPNRTAPAMRSYRAALSNNAEANEYFERGVQVLERRSTASGPKGVEALEQAVAKDPGFALAYTHLAVAYIMKGDYLLATQAAKKAISLNDSLPEAHAAMGFVSMFRDWDWPGAERELRHAVELDPNYARGHHWLAICLQLQRRIPAAQQEMGRALNLDHLSPIINSDQCHLLYFARKYEAAASQCQKTIDLDPDFIPTYDRLEAAYIALGRHEQAVAAAVAGALKGGLPKDSQSITAMREAYATTGIQGVWRVQLNYQSRMVPPAGYYAARCYLRLGEIDHAFQALESGYLVHDFFMPFMNVDPAFDLVRSDPRFIDLARRMGLS